MEPEVNLKVKLELDLLIDKNDLDCEEATPEKIASYLNRKLRTDSDLLGKITESDIVGHEEIQASNERSIKRYSL